MEIQLYDMKNDINALWICNVDSKNKPDEILSKGGSFQAMTISFEKGITFPLRSLYEIVGQGWSVISLW